MKCVVNWIPLRIRVRSRNTQPHLKWSIELTFLFCGNEGSFVEIRALLQIPSILTEYRADFSEFETVCPRALCGNILLFGGDIGFFFRGTGIFCERTGLLIGDLGLF